MKTKHITAITPAIVKDLVKVKFSHTDNSNKSWFKVQSPFFAEKLVKGTQEAERQRKLLLEQSYSMYQYYLYKEV